ncbi:MAG TPA: PIN domain-containing protein [Gallionella sp.]|nr:PIN domain-containing protein [Gallionella sp.]
MPAKAFVDTNIWLYSLVQSGDDGRHRQAADFLLRLDRPVINSQVIREICSNLKKKTSMPEQQLRTLIQGWHQDCKVVHSNASQHLLASRLRESYSFSYWDSLIVAAALDAGCTTLFSEDMQHGQKIESALIVINPFLQ